MKSNSLIWIMAGVLLLSLCVSGVSAACAPTLPIASFTVSPGTTGNAPFDVIFTDSSTFTTSWELDYGDGSPHSFALTPPPPLAHRFYAAGSYTVILTATNCFGADTTTQLITVNEAPGTGHITVTSNPSNAIVYIDGIEQDRRTPFTYYGFAPVKHTVEVSENYYSLTFFPTVIALDNTDVFAELEPVSKTPTFDYITPTSGPIAGNQYVTIVGSKFIDGDGTNTPRLTVKIGTGVATITDVEAGTIISAKTPSSVTSGWKDLIITNGYGQSVTVTGPSGAYYYEAPTTGSLTVTSTPPGAGIWIDTIDQHQVTPYTFTNYPAGSHTVGVQRGGYYASSDVPVNIPAGGSITQDFVLDLAPPIADFDGSPTSATTTSPVTFVDKSSFGIPTGWAWYFGDEAWTGSWTQQPGTPMWTGRYGQGSVTLPDGSIVLMGGSDSTGNKNDVYRSTDNGATWTEMTPNAGWSSRITLASVAMPDGSIVIMGGSGGGYKNDVWRSTNKGATWVQMKPNDGNGWSPRYDHSSVVIPDGSPHGTIVLMGGFDGGALMNDVWHSEDFGATWAQYPTGSPWWSVRSAHTSVVTPDGDIILMGGAGTPRKNDVWLSVNKGATWTQQTPSAGWEARFGLSSVAMPDGSIVVMGGLSNSATKNDVWRSTNKGATWTEVNAGADWSARYSHSSVAMPDGSIVVMGGVGFKNDVWSFNPVGASGTPNPSHTYTTPGTYSVALQSFNAAGYSSKRIAGFITVTGGSAPVADFTYGPTSDFTIEFADASTNTPTSWSWNFGGSGTSTLQNPAHTFPGAGTYSVTLTATNSYGSSSKNKNVVVLAPPPHVGEINLLSSDSIPTGSTGFKVKTVSGDFTIPAGSGDVTLGAKVPMRRNGDGPTTYVYVDSQGVVHSVVGTFNSLPTNVVMQAEDPLSETNGVSTSNAPGQIGFGAVNGLTLKCSFGNCANNYAILIDGGKSPDDNHIRYWNDISFMYQVLTKVYGYPKANIKVLMSDGTNTGLDRHYATVGGVAQKDNSPLDLDSDTISESAYISEASSTNLHDAIESLGSGKGSGDNLFIFTTGHGGESPTGTVGDGNVIYYLWNNAYISDSDFVTILNDHATGFGTISMMMEQCYGGGFSDNFLTATVPNQKRYLATAASNNEPSYGNGFSNVWTRGVGGITDAGKASTEADVSPYGDSNGKVAQPEVCTFAKATDPAATTTLANYEHPQCGANTAAGTATSMYLISTGWIADNQVTLLWPNLAETLYAGFPYDITWTNSPGVANVKIDLLNAGGGSTTNIIPSTAASTGKYTWPLAATRNVAAGTQYRIKISDAANSAVSDTSDWNFEMKTGGVSGSIKVTANPIATPGADIYLDGVKKGTTSTSTGIYTIASVAPGSHTVKAMRTGYIDYTTGVSQPSNTANNPVTFTMDAIGTNSPDDMGTMTITSTPTAAEVWIDGVMKGKTPYSERVIPGTDWKDNNYPRKYSVTVFKEGYKPLTQEVLVSRGMIQNEDQNGHFTLITSSIKSFNANPNPVAVNTPVTLSATVSDSSENAPAIGSVQYSQDEGVTWLPMQVVDSSMDPPSETVTASLPGFSTPEVKSIQIKATDVNGKSMGIDELKIAVFDPSGGYVTGAGYFASPEGTYTKTPDKSGKVVFGIVAKYVKGSLKGETEFVFWSKNTALMAFNSNGYQYLIVASPKAQLMGTGTINRKGSYTFMLTTQDVGIPGFNGKDLIRMKIWDTATGEVIYDNQMFASDSTAPVMPIDFGNIIVKK